MLLFGCCVLEAARRGGSISCLILDQAYLLLYFNVLKPSRYIIGRRYIKPCKLLLYTVAAAR